MQIGHLTLKGKHYEGAIVTLALTATFTLEPNEKRGEKAPHFRAFSGDREIGYAYRESFVSDSDSRTVEFLSIKIDDPVFPQPLHVKAFLSDREQLPLTWNRAKKKAA